MLELINCQLIVFILEVDDMRLQEILIIMRVAMIGFTLTYTSASINKTTANKIVFVIQHNEPFSLKWELFKKKASDKFILITASNVSNISVSGTIFSKIFKLNTFEKSNIQAVCEQEAREYNCSLSECIFTTQDEYSIGLCAELREDYGAYGDRPDAILPYRDKLVAKERLSGSKIKLPKHMKLCLHTFAIHKERYLDTVERAVGYPAFIKPTNEARCKNVFRINSRLELLRCLNSLGTKGEYEIEEFIEGDLYTSVFFVRDSQFNYIGAHKFLFPCFEFMNSQKPLGGYTLTKDDPDSKELQALASEVSKCLPLSNGVAHIEFMKRKGTNEFIFIECAARQPGGFISDIFEKKYGYNLGNLHYSLQSRANFDYDKNTALYYAAWYWPNKLKGVVQALNSPSIKSQYEIQWRTYPSQKLDGSDYLGDSPYRLIFWNKSLDELKEDINSLMQNDTSYTVR